MIRHLSAEVPAKAGRIRRKSALAAAAIFAFAASALAAGRGSRSQKPDAASASSPVDARVDAYVESEMRAEKIPGLALAVIRDGKIVKAKGYGFANLELNVPVKPETVFESGSIGKQFTATAVMMLVEEGKIGLEDKITKYFPDAPPAWREITIRNLLSHESGIKNYTDGKDVNFRQDYSEDQLLKIAEKIGLDFPPGSDWNYSNTGFVVLGILIHKVSGEFYGDFLHQRIFEPLGMTTTRIISESDIIPNRAQGYKLVRGQWKNQDWVSPTLNTTADGSLYFNVRDLAKWDAALYTTRLLKQSSLDQMWTIQKLTSGKNKGQPNKGDYGFGWFIHHVNGHRIIEHGGSWQGFTDQISRYVDDKLTIVVLTNLESAHSRPDRIAHHVAAFYVPAVEPPPPPQPIPDTHPHVTAQLRRILAQLAAGKLELSQFAPAAQKNFDPATQKQVRDFLQDEGALEKLELLSAKSEKGAQVYRYRAIFQSGPLGLTLRIGGGSKITALEFGE